jgi:hypothetical protein
MRSRKTVAVPARLEGARRRFERWRRIREGRSRIPDPLWKSAVKLAAMYGLCRTARTLGLDYNALKKRVESAGLNDSRPGPRPRRKMPARSAPTARNPGSTTRIPKPSHQDPAMTFIELPPLERPGVPECIVELEHPHGAKMRIRLTGCQSPGVVAALSQVFLGVES